MLVPLSVPEIRALIVRLILPQHHVRAFVFAWSAWRRAHQALARACHYQRRRSLKLQL